MQSSEPDFLLFAGDDRTDEDLFTRLPESAWSNHVGDGPSHARFSVRDPARLHEVLKTLAETTHRPARA